MSRTIRSETYANESQAAYLYAQTKGYAHTTAAERAALRGATVRRTQKRAAVRNAPARGRIDVAGLLCGAFAFLMFFCVVAAVGLANTGAGHVKRAAAPVDCSAPVQACEGARACARMVADC